MSICGIFELRKNGCEACKVPILSDRGLFVSKFRILNFIFVTVATHNTKVTGQNEPYSLYYCLIFAIVLFVMSTVDCSVVVPLLTPAHY